MSAGTILVSGNQRLARTLNRIYEQKQIRDGKLTWETPDILSWSAWQQKAWDESLIHCDNEKQALLSNHQALLVWQGTIERSVEANAMLQLHQVARRAQEAWLLMYQWQLSLAEINPSLSSEDNRAFLRWASTYQEYCKQHHWLDTARLPDKLSRYYQSGIFSPPPRMLLLGFDELTPQQQSLFDVMKKAGCEFDQIDECSPARQMRRCRYQDGDRELAEAAKWCLVQYTEAPESRIAVIVSDLEQQRDKVQRIFDEVLQPATLINEGDGGAYNISIGRPLSEWPLVHAFFMLLDFAQDHLELNKVVSLITSPYLQGPLEELEQRYQLDARLRRQGDTRVSISSLQYFAARVDEDGEPYPYTCPLLAEQLQDWQSQREKIRKRLRPGEWAEYFSELVGAMGWPGSDTLGAYDHQCMHSWQGLLSEFAGLESVQALFSFQQAKQQLKRMASAVVFQPRSPESSIQVMGLLEAAGLQFDALWIAGLHDEVWPASPRPNPFLPHKEQRLRGMPRSSAARELQSAQRISERLLQSADLIVVSTAKRDGDSELRPSPLFIHIPEEENSAAVVSDSPLYTERVHQSGELEQLLDNVGPKAEQSRARRGSAVFKLQAECPFRAFAELRLGARALTEAEPGLDAAERGSLVHEMLELFWNKVQTQETLLNYNKAELDELILQVAEQVINANAKSRPLTYTERFRGIEQARLKRYLLQWLDEEKKRKPFSVQDTEKKYQITVAGLSVEVKIDRIDKLEDGTLAIIDYKTGKTTPESWVGERPDDPQLPLYSIQFGDELSAVAFAQVRPGDMGFKGIARDNEQIPGVQAFQKLKASTPLEDWPSVLSYWQHNLQRLAEDYLAGKADVDPKKGHDTCRYCDLTSLCRVNESNNLLPDEQDPGY